MKREVEEQFWKDSEKMEIASGKGEKGDVEKPGTRWEWRRWRRVEREEVGDERSRSIQRRTRDGSR